MSPPGNIEKGIWLSKKNKLKSSAACRLIHEKPKRNIKGPTKEA
jgi:hypothetical protein